MYKFLIVLSMVAFAFMIEKALFFHASIFLPRIWKDTGADQIQKRFPRQFSITNRIYFVFAYAVSCLFAVFSDWRYLTLSIVSMSLTFIAIISFDIFIFVNNSQDNKTKS